MSVSSDRAFPSVVQCVQLCSKSVVVLVVRLLKFPELEPKVGHAVIQVKVFGINHAEMPMGWSDWAEGVTINGIECVGIVKSDPRGEFSIGAKGAALMGGFDRTINSSCAD
jgi:NADPH:quinone reductase